MIGVSLTACANDPKITSTAPEPITSTAISPALPPPNTLSTPSQNPVDFSTWLNQFKAEAQRKGIQASTIQQAAPYFLVNDKILSYDMQQPEFTQTFWTYIQKRLSPIRVQAGKLSLFSNQSLLNDLQQTYGLPPEILVAFWGLETNYGHYLGEFSTIEALTTLAYNPRRSDFFRKELLAALTILEQGHVQAKNMKGSWAGAVGQMQFMPSVFVKHAIDANGDKKADLWNTTDDALASAANYLKAAGWKAQQPWLQAIKLPATFDYQLADGKREFSALEAEQLGIKPLSGQWQSSQLPMTILLPAGHEGPAFATWPNFKVIKRWNNATNYALSVSLLAHQLGAYQEPELKIQEGEKPWRRDFIQTLQQKLIDAGYDTGGADGWFGSRSSQAIRQFQKNNQLPADGYPNKQTLEMLQLAP